MQMKICDKNNNIKLNEIALKWGKCSDMSKIYQSIYLLLLPIEYILFKCLTIQFLEYCEHLQKNIIF